MSNEDSDSESDSDSDSDSEEKFEDPSLQKARDMKKFTDEPIRIPGGDILTAEPQATLLVTNLLGLILKRISDPQLTENIMDNVSKTIELSLENKKNKINYLKNDTGFNNKNNSMIINSLHNEGLTQPTEVITHDDKPFVKSQSIEIKEKEKEKEKDEDKEDEKDDNEKEKDEKDDKEDNKEKDKKDNKETDEIKDEEKDDKAEEKNDEIKDSNQDIKGGRLPFFTEQECSFF
jgi:hypothetical protein